MPNFIKLVIAKFTLLASDTGLAKSSTITTYAISGTLFFGDMLNFLNHNAAAIGVCIAVLTFLMNWYYKHKSSV